MVNTNTGKVLEIHTLFLTDQLVRPRVEVGPYHYGDIVDTHLGLIFVLRKLIEKEHQKSR